MKKRIFTTSLVMAMIAIGILFIGTNVMALEDCNQVWTTGVNSNKFTVPTNGLYTLSSTNYSLKFLGITPVTCPAGVDCKEGTKIYRWDYEFRSALPGCGTITAPAVSQFHFLVPSPVANVENIYYNKNFSKYADFSNPLTGITYSQNKYMGFALWQYQVIRIESDVSSGQYFFYSDKPSNPTPTSIHYWNGPNDFFAATLGPGTPEETYIPFNAVEQKTFGEYLVNIYRDRGTWCASSVEYSDDGGNTWTPVPLNSPPPGTIDSCGTVDGNQRCQECVRFQEASPGCFTYITGGRTAYVPSGCK